jgi:hypothetical protein
LQFSVILYYKREIDAPNTRLGCQFPVRNTKWLKNGKLRKAILPHFTTFRNETLEYY